MRDYTTKGPKKVIQINEKELQQHLNSLVTSTVQEVLNQVLDAEADEMVGAARYERSADRQDYRSGSYTRKLQTKAGEVELNIPKLREQTFQTAINRALQATGVVNRRSFGGDVSCGSVDASGGGYHRGAVGHSGEFGYRIEA